MDIKRDYLCHPENYKRGRAGPVSFLVIHYVGALGNARQNAQYYGGTPVVNASAHYFVDHGPSPEIWQSVAEGDTAWHCGGRTYKDTLCRNFNSIGIEMCCHQDSAGRWYFDPETVDRTVELARDIMARHRIPIENVVRHYDVTGKVCPAPYVNEPGAWAAFKKRLEENDLTETQVREIVEKVLTEHDVTLSAQTVSPWAEADRAWAVGAGLTDGTRPCSAATRQELWATLHRQRKEGT